MPPSRLHRNCVMSFFETVKCSVKSRTLSLPPPNEVMFLLRSVCLFLSVGYWKSCERILTKFLGGVGTKGINLGDDPDLAVRSPKSGFTGLSKKYLVDSDQSCITNLHCKYHSAMLLCWRSVEVCALCILLVMQVTINIAQMSAWKCTKSVCRPRSARTSWGSLQCSSRPLAEFTG